MEKMELSHKLENDKKERGREAAKKIEEAARYIDTLSDEQIIEGATEMLNDLGLTLDDLANKKILDLGSGPQIIERAATIKGTGTVFSVDSRPYALSKRPEVKNGIVADIRKGIPQIKTNSIDLLISHAGPPTIPAVSRKKEDVNFSINEILRMLKDGGEARIRPLGLYFIEEKYERYRELREKNRNDLTEKEKDEKRKFEDLITEESLNYLKEKGLNIVSRKNEKGWTYGIIRK